MSGASRSEALVAPDSIDMLTGEGGTALPDKPFRAFPQRPSFPL